MPGIILENWNELPIESTIENFDTKTGEFVGYRKFRGPWTERFTFLQNVLPQITYTSDSPAFNRNLYYYPNIDGMVAYSAEITGHLKPSCTGPDSAIEYEKAEILVSYKADTGTFFLTSGVGGNPTESPTNQPTIKTNYQLDTEIQHTTIPGKDVQNAEGKRQQAQGDFNFQLHLINLKVTYQETPYVGWSSIFNNLGKINSGSISISDLVLVFGLFPPKTLLYHGPSAITKTVVRNWDSTENKIVWDLVWDITHNFSFNRLRWDKKVVGIKPQAVVVGQNPSDIDYVFDNIKLYPFSSDDFGFLNRFGVVPEPEPTP